MNFKLRSIWGYALCLTLGLVLGILLQTTSFAQAEFPTNLESVTNSTKTPTLEQASPSDWIKEKDVRVYYDHIEIDIENAAWATFTNTNSMDPVFDETAHALQKIPTNPKELQVGDIISYQPEGETYIVIHRIINISNDGEWFAIVKGDNNTNPDAQKVRFSQVKKVLVGILY